jgi:predicted phage tail protein
MSTELIIAGEMGKGGGSTEYKDTLISEQTVKTLFAVGEGVIDSVENVYLDTVEIANFDATLAYRVGTSSQEVIDGFTVTESPLPGFTAKNIIRDSTKKPGQELPNVSTGITVAAISLVKNTWYRITSVGSTDFKSFGAAKNAVGTVFQASKAGSSTSGTGSTVQMEPNFQVPETIVSIPYEEPMKSVRCSFTFSALSKTDGDGNIVGSTVVFEVYIRNNTTTGLWTLLNNKQYTVKGKTTHGYTFDLEINRPTTATTTWQIKVIRITPDSGTVKKQDTMQWSAVTQLYHSDLAYPGTALAAVTLRDATQFGNRIPEIMFKVKGKKIRLPTNYTPGTSTTVGTYNGNWDGTLHTTYLQYSNNPAWCLYDVLTDVNSGLGIPEADLDKYSFYNLGKYCDDSLPNGYSEAVVCRDNGEVLEEPYPLYIPRHTLDYSFNTRENVKDFLSQILSLCNANLITNEFGQVAVIFQQRGQIVKRNVTNANVIDGTFTYQSSNIEQRTNLVNVTYNRGLNFGRTDTATVSDDSLIDRYGLRPTDVVLPGCYYEAQAIRKARWVLYTNCYFTDFVTFSVFLDGMTYKIGDLVRVYDNYNQTNTQSGLLTSAVISGSSTTLTFDREISLLAGTYTFYSYDSSGNEVTKVISGGYWRCFRYCWNFRR